MSEVWIVQVFEASILECPKLNGLYKQTYFILIYRIQIFYHFRHEKS
jgi:hypothetical protein